MKLIGHAIIHSLSFAAFILLATGCGSKVMISNFKTPPSPAVSNVIDATHTVFPAALPSPAPQENVSTMDIVNLNSMDNRHVLLKLPDTWSATKQSYNFDDSFVYKQDKNKGIRKGHAYTILDDKKEKIGEYYNIGYYPDQPNGASLPNHCEPVSPKFDGETKLGTGQIYLLNCDIMPKEKRTEKIKTFDQIYVVIPIEGETQAYNFSFSVPLGESSDRYLKIMKEMLVGNTAGSS
jgi:hypothetical protein